MLKVGKKQTRPIIIGKIEGRELLDGKLPKNSYDLSVREECVSVGRTLYDLIGILSEIRNDKKGD